MTDKKLWYFKNIVESCTVYYRGEVAVIASSEEEAIEKMKDNGEWKDADFSHAIANDDDYEYDFTDAELWKVEDTA